MLLSQIAAFIIGLRRRVRLSKRLRAVPRHAGQGNVYQHAVGAIPVDTAGTGGDGAHLQHLDHGGVCGAGAGVVMAKHGNRAASSTCGSADLLEALGVNIGLEPAGVEASIREVGMGFLFAPALHGAMRHAIGPRREIGVRTVFNILGPLTNPARAQHQLVGVYDGSLTAVMAMVLQIWAPNGPLWCTAATV